MAKNKKVIKDGVVEEQEEEITQPDPVKATAVEIKKEVIVEKKPVVPAKRYFFYRRKPDGQRA